MALTRSCTASIDIAAPIDVVWDLVSDITRIGEWSVECRSCEWLADATDPRPGARFPRAEPAQRNALDTHLRGPRGRSAEALRLADAADPASPGLHRVDVRTRRQR